MPIIGTIASSTRQGQNVDTGAMFPLQVITVGAAGASSITFTNIPSTYAHLQVRAFARTNRANNDDQLKVSFNGDLGANYTAHQIYGDGTSTTSFGLSASALNGQFGAIATGASNASNQFGASIMDILDYANTNKNKTVRTQCGVDWNSAGYSILNSFLWLNTAAITSIQFVPANGTLISQYSQVALYGIKGA